METFIYPFLKGFGLSAGLIIAIGAQNAFILKQGIKQQHVFLIVLICSIWDTLMIYLGAGGFGTLLAKFPMLTKLSAVGGAIFLFGYGTKSFYSALYSTTKTISLDSSMPLLHNRKKIILATLGFSILNPHVYLDTVILLGAVAAQYALQKRAFFAVGACAASFTWFFILGYGARKLTPFFKKSYAWRILDTLIGFIMWSIAISLWINF